AYMVEKVVHVEIVFAVALIAVARKVIVLDVAKYPSLTLIAIGVIIIALSVSYYLIKRIDRTK
ncbi:MAG: phosphate-starvation-inducible PsiE family protein, partial [Nitrospirota bacterium]